MGFIVKEIFSIMGCQSLLQLGALSVRLSNIFYYREAETVCPRSRQPFWQGDSSESFARFWG